MLLPRIELEEFYFLPSNSFERINTTTLMSNISMMSMSLHGIELIVEFGVVEEAMKMDFWLEPAEIDSLCVILRMVVVDDWLANNQAIDQFSSREGCLNILVIHG